MSVVRCLAEPEKNPKYFYCFAMQLKLPDFHISSLSSQQRYYTKCIWDPGSSNMQLLYDFVKGIREKRVICIGLHPWKYIRMTLAHASH